MYSSSPSDQMMVAENLWLSLIIQPRHHSIIMAGDLPQGWAALSYNRINIQIMTTYNRLDGY